MTSTQSKRAILQLHPLKPPNSDPVQCNTATPTKSTTWAQLIKPTTVQHDTTTTNNTPTVDTNNTATTDTGKPKRIRYKKSVTPETLERRRIEQERIAARQARKPQKQLQTFSSLINFDILEQNEQQHSTPQSVQLRNNTVKDVTVRDDTTVHNKKHNKDRTIDNTPNTLNAKRVIGVTGIDPTKANYITKQSINTIIANNNINRNILDHNVTYTKMSKTREHKKQAKPTKVRTAMNTVHIEQYIRTQILQPIIDQICNNSVTIEYYEKRKQLKREKAKLKRMNAKTRETAQHGTNVTETKLHDTDECKEQLHIPTQVFDVYWHNQTLQMFGQQPHLGLMPLIQQPTQTFRLSTLYTQYCTQLFAQSIDTCVLQLLERLYTFYQRKYEQATDTTRLKRRYVSGLKEVYKKLELNDIKCVIIACNIEYDNNIENGISTILQQILDAAMNKHVPVIYACKRKELARCMHISHSRISAIGLLDVNGAYDIYNKLLELKQQYTEQYYMLNEDKLLTMRIQNVQ